jgi:hypothetical protein
VAEDVAVTKVTVDYAFGGKAFTVVFANPKELRAILFHRTDLDRLKKGQAEDTKEAVMEHRLDPLTPVPLAVKGEPTQASAVETGADATTASLDMGLWWHTSACTFFHPEKA